MDFESIHNNIRIISDVHLEHYDSIPDFNDIITPSSTDILCLAGDIGNPIQRSYKLFIEWCTKNFFKVLVIAGNHEYYGSSINIINSVIEHICNQTGAIFLNNKIFINKNYAFIGTTLWSHIPDEAKFDVENSLNDYRLIRDFTIEENNRIHQENVSFLQQSIDELKEKYKLIVVTHHSPSRKNTSYPPYERDDRMMNYAFSSDQSEIIKQVDLWLYGHTHYNHEGNHFLKYNTPLVSNQRGYIDNLSKNYNKDFVIYVN